jgi:hypothetical protein
LRRFSRWPTPRKNAKFFSRSRDAVIRVYDEAGNVIETHEHAGEFKEWQALHVKQKAATQ